MTDTSLSPYIVNSLHLSRDLGSYGATESFSMCRKLGWASYTVVSLQFCFNYPQPHQQKLWQSISAFTQVVEVLCAKVFSHPSSWTQLQTEGSKHSMKIKQEVFQSIFKLTLKGW